MRINKNTSPHNFPRFPRCTRGAVVKTGAEGVPQVVAHIYLVLPVDGAGRLYVGVVDYEHPDGTKQYTHSAAGYGYDKMAAALSGATVGGVVLGDHCNSKGHPRIDELCRAKGWLYIRP